MPRWNKPVAELTNWHHYVFGSFLGLFLLLVVGLFWLAVEAGRHGELITYPARLIYVATDEESFRLLQTLPKDDSANLEAAERSTHRRILALGSGQSIRRLSELYFDGNRFYPESSARREDRKHFRRVLKVEVLDGSARGAIVFALGSEVQFSSFL